MEPDVGRIYDDHLQCVVYLYPSISDAEQGKAIGGTGFLAKKSLGEGLGFQTYIVTNRHIIESGNVVVRLNTVDSAIDCLDTDEREWAFHPAGDDIAALPVVLGPAHLQWQVDMDGGFWTGEDIVEHGLGPGDETFSVGRFISQEGRQRNLPTARFGNIAQMPGEPVPDERPSGTFHQDSFLVEARSISGYSGAPVFAVIPPFTVRGLRPDHTIIVRMDQIGPALLGVNWAHMNDRVPAYDENGNELSYKVKSNSGMMAVVPAWKLGEMLDMPKLRQDREARAAADRKRIANAAATPTDAAQPRENKKFERTIRNMLSTPPNPRSGKSGDVSKRDDEPSA